MHLSDFALLPLNEFFYYLLIGKEVMAMSISQEVVVYTYVSLQLFQKELLGTDT